MTQEEIEKRVEKAKNYFSQGYNCAQSVVLTFADFIGVSEQMAATMAGGFGGGIGRMRTICGAFSGAVIVAGFIRPVTDDPQSKAHNYALVQEMAAEFKAQTGSLICAELLGVQGEVITNIPEPRTKEYYQKRPCSEMVAMATRIVGKHITD